MMLLGSYLYNLLFMATNIITLLTEQLDDIFVSNTASTVNEQPSNIKKALTAIVPSFLLSLLNRKKSFGGETLKDLFQISNKFNSGTGGASETNILKNLVWGGDNFNLTNELSRFAGISNHNAQILVDKATPTMVNTLSNGKPANTGIFEWILEQKDNILTAVPADFNIASALGLANLGSLFSGLNKPEDVKYVNQQRPTPPPPPPPVKKSNGSGFMWILLLALAAFLLWWLFGKGCNNEESSNIVTDTTMMNNSRNSSADTQHTTTQSKVDADGNYIYDLGENTVINLADGSSLNVGVSSTEYRLYDFINKGTIDETDKTKNWITCDRVYFKTGLAELTDDSKEQVENIAKILKNYPKVKIKLGGYTDNTGDAAQNKKLSDDRAKIVAKMFGDLGVAKQVEEAVGYGPEHPIATNDTDEGRAQNRRVDLKVSAK